MTKKSLKYISEPTPECFFSFIIHPFLEYLKELSRINEFVRILFFYFAVLFFFFGLGKILHFMQHKYAVGLNL